MNGTGRTPRKLLWGSALLALACSSQPAPRAGQPVGGEPASARLGPAAPPAGERANVGEPAHADSIPAFPKQARTSAAETDDIQARKAAAPNAEPGRADSDPKNDYTVAPPEVIADCEARLEAAGIRHRAAKLPLRTNAKGAYTCGAEQVVIYQGGPENIAYNAPPLLTCGMALAFGRFETVLQAEATRALGSRVKRIRQGGTYSCRKMARFTTMVSEHSYANAIDIYGFVLENGRHVSVQKDFGRVDTESTRAESVFLRTLARRAFDEDVFSVVVTPFFDKLHHDHIHFDLARYRTDGARRLED